MRPRRILSTPHPRVSDSLSSLGVYRYRIYRRFEYSVFVRAGPAKKRINRPRVVISWTTAN